MWGTAFPHFLYIREIHQVVPLLKTLEKEQRVSRLSSGLGYQSRVLSSDSESFLLLSTLEQVKLTHKD